MRRQGGAHLSALQKHAPYKLLKPLFQAYLFGLFSSTAPRIIGLLLAIVNRKICVKQALQRISAAIQSQTRFDRLPTSYAILIGGSTVLPRLVSSLILRARSSFANRPLEHPLPYERSLIFACAFVASLLSFRLLNREESKEEDFPRSSTTAVVEAGSGENGSHHRKRSSLSSNATDTELLAQGEIPLAGKTLDLTLFALVRAIDVCAKTSWDKREAQRLPRSHQSRISQLLEKIAAPSVFSFSCAIVMWAWFHAPHRLPPSYRRFISSAAQIDHRLITALRQCHYGNFVYGKDTGMAPLLGSLARELGQPPEWGDPSLTIPIPCELYHSGTGPNCEYHALSRFWRSYKFAVRMYLPLNCIVFLRRGFSKATLVRVLTEANRSATFLASFIALFYYGVCLARTRLAPKLFSRDRLTPQMCDGGVGVGTGCLLCGWSILVEQPNRQPEFALFVAPRALATILPRRYDRKFLGREQFVFASSVALMLTTARIRPDRIRGILGKLLQLISE